MLRRALREKWSTIKTEPGKEPVTVAQPDEPPPARESGQSTNSDDESKQHDANSIEEGNDISIEEESDSPLNDDNMPGEKE